MNRIGLTLLAAFAASPAITAQPLTLIDGTTAGGGTTSRGGALALTGAFDLADVGRMMGGTLVLNGGWEIEPGTPLPGPEPGWVLRSSSGPSARSGHALAYDAARQVTVLFGGSRKDGQGNLETLGDLWEWDGATWTLRLPHGSTTGWSYSGQTGWHPAYADQPVPRSHHNLAFDGARGRIVLFGGQSFDPNGRQWILNDTWEWDGTAWQFRAHTGPAPRLNAAMAYDSDRGVTVMTGGFLNGPDPTPGAVWEWTGTVWALHSPASGPSTSYSQDAGAMAYDRARKVTVFGPSVGDTWRWTFWEWDGTDWTRTPDVYVAELFGRQYGDLTYDTDRGRALWFGGLDPISDATALFDGQRWTLETNSVVRPSPRAHLALAYDSARHATVLFGGETAGPAYSGETWELLASNVPLINEQPSDLKLQPGETATFHVGAVNPAGAPLAYQWFREGTPLADDSRVTGAQSDTLRIAGLVLSDTGHLRARIRSGSAETVSRPAILSLRFDLEVRVAPSELSLLWSASAAALEHADRPEGPWTPVAGASSPFRPPLTGTARFFRLRPALELPTP